MQNAHNNDIIRIGYFQIKMDTENYFVHRDPGPRLSSRRLIGEGTRIVKLNSQPTAILNDVAYDDLFASLMVDEQEYFVSLTEAGVASIDDPYRCRKLINISTSRTLTRSESRPIALSFGAFFLANHRSEILPNNKLRLVIISPHTPMNKHTETSFALLTR